MSKNPVDDFLALKKTADPLPGFMEHMRHAASGALATAAVGAGVAGVGIAASKIFDAATKSRDFKSMLEANPDLQDHHQSDPKRFNMMFSTLRTMNPNFSKDPLIAGAFMRRMSSSPEGIGGIAGEALKHRQDFGTPFMEDVTSFAREGARAGVGESMGAPAHAAQFIQKERHHMQDMAEKAREAGIGRQFEHEKQIRQLRAQMTQHKMPQQTTQTKYTGAVDPEKGSDPTQTDITTVRKGFGFGPFHK